MTKTFRACAVIPTLDNPLTVRAVVEEMRARELPVILVDDGSGEAGKKVCAELAAEGLVTLERFEDNRGKGAAVLAGFRLAQSLGFTHALQVDADGQHDMEQTETFVAAARENPRALVIAYPEYDESAPRSRRFARKLTSFWVAIEVGSRSAIRDAMIGFRVYPLDATLAIPRVGTRMDFDIEVAVRLVRAGVPTINLPVAVRYPRKQEGGISHFRPVRDNLSFSLMHSRLCMEGCVNWFRRLAGGDTR